MNLTPEQSKRYKQMADEHAEFLCEQMFKPVFKMAFLHGAKHMFEEVMTGPGFTTEIQINIPEETPSNPTEDAMEAKLLSLIDWQNSQVSTNGRNALHRHGFRMYKDLCEISKREISRLKNVGKHSVKQVEEHLDELGLSFKQEE